MSRHHITSPISRLVLLNCCTAFTLLLLLCLGGRLTDKLDIVRTPLGVTEVFCSYLLIMNLVKIAIIRDSTASFPPSTKSKTMRSKLQKTASACATLVLSLILFHLVIVLFGAPVLHSASETFHLSCLLTLTSTFPCVCAIGSSVDAWMKTWNTYNKSGEFSREFSALVVALCSVVGAWVGAVPIPLDWDRPWQVWPVSCLIGCVLGHCAGLILVSILLVREQKVKGRSKLLWTVSKLEWIYLGHGSLVIIWVKWINLIWVSERSQVIISGSRTDVNLFGSRSSYEWYYLGQELL